MPRWTGRTLPLPPGRAAARPTLLAMRQLVQRAVQRLDVTLVAHDLVRDLPSRDRAAELERLLDWVRDRLRYTNDPVGPLQSVELVKAPWSALQEIREHGRFVGDCDDAVVLLAALLGAVGRPVRIVAGAVDRRRPLEMSHVWLEAHDGRRWVALDPIMPGWRPGRHVDPQDLQVRPRYVKVGAEMSGIGFVSPTSVHAAQAQPRTTQVMPSDDGFWDSAKRTTDGIVGALNPLWGAYSAYRASRDGGRSGAQPRLQTPVASRPASVRVGMFQKLNTGTGQVETDWTRVALVAGGVGLVGALIFLPRRGARRRSR